jgi:hypothetical protein
MSISIPVEDTKTTSSEPKHVAGIFFTNQFVWSPMDCYETTFMAALENIKQGLVLTHTISVSPDES